MLRLDFCAGMIRRKLSFMIDESLDRERVHSKFLTERSNRPLRERSLASQHLGKRRVIGRKLPGKRPQRISQVGLATLRQNTQKMKSETPIHARMIGKSC